MLIDLLTIFQTIIISLGVGSSTLAITNFFVAIWDGKIDEHERRMMGIVYIVLRVVMIAILFTTLSLTILYLLRQNSLTAFIYQNAFLVTILFINAILMTYCKLPSAFGPAIQVSAWYTLGLMTAFSLVEWSLSYGQFLLLYITMLFLAISIINAIMMYSKRCQELKKVCIHQ